MFQVIDIATKTVLTEENTLRGARLAIVDMIANGEVGYEFEVKIRHAR